MASYNVAYLINLLTQNSPSPDPPRNNPRKTRWSAAARRDYGPYYESTLRSAVNCTLHSAAAGDRNPRGWSEVKAVDTDSEVDVDVDVDWNF